MVLKLLVSRHWQSFGKKERQNSCLKNFFKMWDEWHKKKIMEECVYSLQEIKLR